MKVKLSVGRLAQILIVLISVVVGLQANAAEPVDTLMLESLNVVAIKQSDKLREEAVSGTLLTQAQVENLNAYAIKSISDVVPNFYIPDYGSRITSSIYVRGIGARMDQPAVGLNVDNVPFLNKDAYDFDLPDIASVEMLRGPQSTLYGRNTMGGLISVSTLSPMQWQGWRFLGEAGTAETFRLYAGYYHKFSRKTALSVNLSAFSTAGLFTNKFNNSKVDKEKSASTRLKFEWRPKSTFHLLNSFCASLLRQGGYPYQSVESGEINYNDTCFYRRLLITDGLTLKKMHEKFTATSITSLQYIDDNMTLDQDFLPLSYFVLTQKKKELGLTQDFTFRSVDNGQRYSWICGLFGFYKHLRMQAPVTFKDVGIANLIESHRNDANPYMPIRWDEREFPLNSDFTIPTYGLALYHESKLTLGRWRLTAGLRFDYEHASMHYLSDCSTGYTIYNRDDNYAPMRHVDIEIHDRGDLKRYFMTLLPKLSALYNLDSEERNNLYVSVSKGYKAGGFNTQMFSDVLQQRLMSVMGIGGRYDVDDIVGYEPEDSWNFEIGSHLSFPSLALQADLATFYIECHNQQLTVFPDGTTTGRIMTNAGKTRSFGAEASVNWSISSAFNLLRKGDIYCNISYGFTDARFIRFNDGREDYSGRYLPYVPANTLFLQGIYTLPLNGKFVKGLQFDVNLRGTGRIFWNESNSLVQPFYVQLGVSASVEGKNWTLELFAKNITSTRFYTFYFKSIENEFLQRGRPFTCGVTLRVNLSSKNRK